MFDDATIEGTDTDNGTLVFNLTRSDTFSGTLTGDDSLIVEGDGTLVMDGGDAFTGSATISGGTLELTSATAIGDGPIIFVNDGPPTLKIDGTTMPTNVIRGFVAGAPNDPGDTIDLASVPFDSASGVTLLEAGNLLQVFENGQDYSLQFDPSLLKQVLAGQTLPYNFTLSSDNDGGTDINLSTEGEPTLQTLADLSADVYNFSR